MSTAAVNISLTSSFDSSGVSKAKDAVRDVSNYTESLRKNSLFRENRAQSAGLLNLSRQASDVFSQGLAGTSPFTIAIQQGPQILDILASGSISAGRFSLALGALAIGVGGIMGATSAYQKMSEAIDDAAAAQERLNKSRDFTEKSVLEMGIAPGKEEDTINKLTESYNKLEAERNKIINEAPSVAMSLNQRPGSAYRGTKFAEMVEGTFLDKFFDVKTYTASDIIGSNKRLPQIDQQMGLISKAFSRVKSGEASSQGGLRLFNQQISKDAMQGIEQRGIESAAEMVSASQLKFMQEALASGLKKADAMQDTPEKANLLNSLQYLSEWLTKLGTAVEKVQERRMGMARDELDRFFSDIDSASKENANNKQKSTQLNALRAAQVSARQSIGGMANAPILSSYQKQTDYLAKIAETSRMTAQNTSKTTLPAAPVSTAN